MTNLSLSRFSFKFIKLIYVKILSSRFFDRTFNVLLKIIYLFIYIFFFFFFFFFLIYYFKRRAVDLYIYRFLCTYELECVCVYFLFLSSSVMLTSAAKYFFFFSSSFRLKSTMYIIEYRNAFLSSFEATTTIEFYIYTLESRLMIYFWLSTHRRQ